MHTLSTSNPLKVLVHFQHERFDKCDMKRHPAKKQAAAFLISVSDNKIWCSARERGCHSSLSLTMNTDFKDL